MYDDFMSWCHYDNENGTTYNDSESSKNDDDDDGGGGNI